MKLLKRIGRNVLPANWIFFYHSMRVARQLDMTGIVLRTLWKNAGRRIRLGGEGGWTIPRTLLRKDSICYCLGCGEDITFDLEVIRQYACTVFAFDPTPQAIEYVARHTAHLLNYRFTEVAIWDKEDTVRFYAPGNGGVSHSITNLEGTDEFIEVPTRRLKAVMDENGHARLALLKMDIEGAEHTVLRTIVEDQLQIDVLCVEFDELASHGTPDRLATIKQTLQSLRDFGYEYFWFEGSNFTFIR